MEVGSLVRLPDRDCEGNEKAKARPGILAAIHDNWGTVIPLTSRNPSQPTHVATFVLGKKGIAACEHPTSFLLKNLGDYGRSVPPSVVSQVKQALRVALGLEIVREPPGVPRFFRGSLVGVFGRKWMVVSNDLGNYYGRTLIVANKKGWLETVDMSRAVATGETDVIPETLNLYL